MVESSGLLNRRTGLNLYRGFESPPLRQPNKYRLYAKDGGAAPIPDGSTPKTGEQPRSQINQPHNTFTLSL